MTSCHVFIAVSLDGFIARRDGSIDWLVDGWPKVDHDYGYKAFSDTIDGLIMGRASYEKALTFEAWPYDKPVVVLSNRLTGDDVREDLKGRVTIERHTPREIVSEVRRRDWARAYIDGGQLIQSFLRDGLIEDLTITRLPVLIGDGLPLFGSLERDIQLDHDVTMDYGSGFVQSRYRIRR